MSLTIKDFFTTFLAGATFGIYYAMSKGIDLPLITGTRGAILLMGIIGIAMCALSGGANNTSNPLVLLASILGITALVLIIYGLISGAKIALLLLMVVILSLWMISTFRHMITPIA